jgi:hypothetical protein
MLQGDPRKDGRSGRDVGRNLKASLELATATKVQEGDYVWEAG